MNCHLSFDACHLSPADFSWHVLCFCRNAPCYSSLLAYILIRRARLLYSSKHLRYGYYFIRRAFASYATLASTMRNHSLASIMRNYILPHAALTIKSRDYIIVSLTLPTILQIGLFSHVTLAAFFETSIAHMLECQQFFRKHNLQYAALAIKSRDHIISSATLARMLQKHIFSHATLAIISRQNVVSYAPISLQQYI